MRFRIAMTTAALVSASVASIATSADHDPIASSAGPTTVTLPTGDRVLIASVDGREVIRVEPRSAGSSATAASVISANGHTYVVPAAADGWIGRGLSLSMFDVTALAQRPVGQTLTLSARFGPTYAVLPPGLGRTSASSVAVLDPEAFGAALSRASALADRARTPSTLLRGVSLTLPGSPATADGLLTAPSQGPLYTVTVNGIDRSGDKDFGDIAVLTNTDDTSRFIAGQTFYRGTFSFSVPRGHYSVQAYISTVDARGQSYTLATVPQFFVGHDRTVTLDARKGTRVSVTTPRPSSTVHGELNLQRVPATGLPFTDSLTTFDATPLFATPTRAVTVGQLYFYPAMRLGDGDGSIDRYLYDVEFPARQLVPADLHYDVTAGSIATVHSSFASVLPGRVEEESRIGGLPWQTVLVGAVDNLTAPTSRTEYVTARRGLLWHQEVDLDPADDNGRTLARSEIYRSGEHVDSLWNDQPMGSGVEQENDVGQPCPVCRTGDTLLVTVFPHVDAQNDIMLADSATTEQLTLYQDGTDVGESRSGFASFALSPDPASYQLVYDTDTTATWWPTSTHVSTTWGFTSQERPPSQLPPGWTCGGKLALADDGCSFEDLLLPHYATTAGLDGVVPAGTVAHVTVTVAPQEGLGADPLASLTAQVSYDGGTTWRDVDSARRSGTAYRLTYTQPKLSRTDGFASLRIVATAASGSTVGQTVLHAYPLTTPHVASVTARQPGCATATPAPMTQCLTVVGSQSTNAGDPPQGYGPADLQKAYDLPTDPTSHATVAVVVPFDDPNAAADLATYRKQFGLPRCTVASGCLTILNQRGRPTPLPAPSPDWAVQTSQALDAISATCPTCRLLLVEADSASLVDLVPAALTADRLKADVISNGYGTTGEFSGETRFEHSYQTIHVPFVVASDDYGYGNGAPLIGSISYPSASRYAVAVGGTTLTSDSSERGFSETVWANTTSGCSAYIAKPSWQHDRDCHLRTTADVAAVADPATAIAVYDTFGYPGWVEVGGTSLATAVVAGVFGLNGNVGSQPPAAALYQTGASLYDVTEGSNGECQGSYLCLAGPGYDGPSGVGTPDGPSAF